MQYDFDQVVDRSSNLSAKYDERVEEVRHRRCDPPVDRGHGLPDRPARHRRADGPGRGGHLGLHRPARTSYFEAVRGTGRSAATAGTSTRAFMSFSPGVVQTLSAMVRLYTPEGGSVLIQTPVYGEFYDMTEMRWNRQRAWKISCVEQDGAVDGGLGRL